MSTKGQEAGPGGNVAGKGDGVQLEPKVKTRLARLSARACVLATVLTVLAVACAGPNRQARATREPSTKRAEPAVNAKDVVAMVATPAGDGYWLLTARGSVSSFGKARILGNFPKQKSFYIDLATTKTGRGLWGLTEDGRVARLGDAPDLGEFASTESQPQAAGRSLLERWLVPSAEAGVGDPLCCAGLVALEGTPSGQGLWTLSEDGHVFSLGDARRFSPFGAGHIDPGVCCAGLVAIPSGKGLRTLTDDGQAFSLGDAPHLSQQACTDSNPQALGRSLLERWLVPTAEAGVGDPLCCRGLVALEGTPSGTGLWALRDDGRVFSFGKAPCLSPFGEGDRADDVGDPGVCCRGLVALERTPSGKGLWTVDTDGDVFAVGDAELFGPASVEVDTRELRSGQSTAPPVTPEPLRPRRTLTPETDEPDEHEDRHRHDEDTPPPDAEPPSHEPPDTPLP